MALTNSADTPNSTFYNGYAWGGHPQKDKAVLWAQNIESGVYKHTTAGRGPSPLIWGDCAFGELVNGVGGYAYFNDFMGPIDVTTADGYIITAVNSGAIVGDITLGGGALLIDSAGNNAADDGVTVQLPNCQVLPVAGSTIWFEARVQMNDTSANISQFFVGLSESDDATIIAAGAIDDASSKAGYFRAAGSTADKLSVICANDAANDTDADKVTVADGTWVKLGFVMDGLTSIKWYADNVLVHTSSVTAQLPDEAIGLAFVAQTEGASKDAELLVDWVRIAQTV